MNKERRRDPRTNAATHIHVKIQSAPGAHELEGRTIPTKSMDISIGGLCMKLELPLPAQSFLELQITFLDTSERFLLGGSVIWNDPKSHIVGIQFNLANYPRLDAWKHAFARLTPID